MSDRRLVIVRRADRMPLDGLHLLADYAGDPNPGTTLVLVATKMAKNLRVYKAVDALGGVAEYKPPARREYPRTVIGMFADRGKTVDLDAAEGLIQAVGYDLSRLAIETEKIVSYTGAAKTTLSRHDIDDVVSTTAPTSVFDFLDALGSRDARSALRMLEALLSQGESVHGIHAMSVRHIRKLISISALRARKEGVNSPGVVAREVGVPDWQVKRLDRQAGRFSAVELVYALDSAASTETRMKTSRDSRLAFERWILETCESA